MDDVLVYTRLFSGVQVQSKGLLNQGFPHCPLSFTLFLLPLLPSDCSGLVRELIFPSSSCEKHLVAREMCLVSRDIYASHNVD